MVYKGKTILTALAALMLVLVLVNILLSFGNQSLRAEVGERQQFITQSIQLEGTASRNRHGFGDRGLENQRRAAQKFAGIAGHQLRPNSAAARRRKVIHREKRTAND